MWTIQQHATIAAIFGVAVIGVWFMHRRRGASSEELEPLTWMAAPRVGAWWRLARIVYAWSWW